VWSPDGSQLAYIALRIPSDWSLDGKFLNCSSSQLGESFLFALPISGDHKPVEVAKSIARMLAARLSPDSRFIAYRSDESGKPEVYVRSFDPPGAQEPPAPENGRSPVAVREWWLAADCLMAFISNESERNQLWGRGFDAASGTPTAESKWWVSTDGADTMFMAVELSKSPSFQPGTPELLFRIPSTPQRNAGAGEERHSRWPAVRRYCANRFHQPLTGG
jgi:hypothetical protein